MIDPVAIQEVTIQGPKPHSGVCVHPFSSVVQQKPELYSEATFFSILKQIYCSVQTCRRLCLSDVVSMHHIIALLQSPGLSAGPSSAAAVDPDSAST